MSRARGVPRVPEAAEEGIERFVADYGAKYPKAAASLTRAQEHLLTLYDFPAEHWKHIRTTVTEGNLRSHVVESPFATVRLRQRVAKGAGSRARGLVFAYKLLDTASRRRRRLDGSHLLPLVRAGAKFVNGTLQERDDSAERKAAA